MVVSKKVDICIRDKLFSKSVGGLNENEDNNETWEGITNT
jgi:hypothetical protein